MTIRRFLFGAVLLSSMAGCASNPRIVYTLDELQVQVERRLGAERARQIIVPFKIDDDMLALSRQLAGTANSREERLNRLVLALSDPGGFGLKYDPRALTGDARQVLERGIGNCVSLSALFVGLARANGLEVFFVDARGVQEYASAGSLNLDLRHMVVGFGSPPRIRVIDFDRVVATHVKYRALSDLQALARYYNNLGYEDLSAGRLPDAEDKFRTAIALDDRFAGSYNNLGVVLLRMGRFAEAEFAFGRASGFDPVYAAPLVNQSILLERQGRKHEADRLRAEIVPLKLRDPLWRAMQGHQAANAGDTDRAVHEYSAAVRLDPDLTSAWLRLALLLESKGEHRKALRAAERVLEQQPESGEARALVERLGGTPPAATPE